ncbi:MAG: TIGR03905 family TSCPD domain-containing protein, partial [[Eubacterium] sulci]|nr:TIGR03905 family TSCPD domain-containing protein [[Eubacterium] sulci]
GNLKAISNLVKGMTLEEVRERLQGITCGFKDTSCADQLVHALEEAAKNGK